MLGYLTLILLCQLSGEIIAKMAKLPVPGPVIGMVILFLILSFIGKTPKELDIVGDFLLGYLPLLFVPAGVGVITNLDILIKSWIPITGAIIIGTGVTIAVTGLLMEFLNRRRASGQKGRTQ